MSTLRRSLAAKFLETYSCLVLQFGTSVVLARLITPEDLGTYGVAAAVLGLAQALREMGIGNYLVQEQELTRAKIRAACFLAFATSWFAAVGLFAATPIIGEYYGPDVRRAATILLLTVVMSPFALTIMAVLQREMNFVAIMKINLASAAANAATSILLASQDWGYMALVWGAVAGQAALVVVAVVLHPATDHFRPSYRGVRAMVRFGTYSFLTSTLQQFSTNIANLIIARSVTLHEMGVFSRGQSFTGLFSRLFMDGIYPVVLPKLSEMRRSGTDPGPSALQAIGYLAIIAWPFFAFVSLYADPLILLFFGAQWTETIGLLHFMAIAGIFWIVSPIVNPLLIAVGHIDRTLHIQIVNQSIAVGGVLYAASQGIEAVAIATIPISAAQAVVWGIALHRIAPITAGTLLKALGSPAAVTACAVGFAAGAYWGTAGLPPFWRLGCGGLAAASGWLLGVFAVRHPLAGEIVGVAQLGRAELRRRLKLA